MASVLGFEGVWVLGMVLTKEQKKKAVEALFRQMWNAEMSAVWGMEVMLEILVGPEEAEDILHRAKGRCAAEAASGDKGSWASWYYRASEDQQALLHEEFNVKDFDELWDSYSFHLHRGFGLTGEELCNSLAREKAGI